MKTELNRRDAIKSMGAVAAVTGTGVINPLLAEENWLDWDISETGVNKDKPKNYNSK
jgi:hypothetical protein